ncbi:MAG TPA: LLM class flavin-dependent oxidoreductase, partial [Candidatus Dormibacteraeota bacterium]|nr:LLM class flavin-dependent oxidoreductase [Candidatus Dormibacteraeota bacterium]
EQVVEKILFQHEVFHHDRTLLQFSVGSMPHRDLMRSIELFGTDVAPVIRRELGREATPAGTIAGDRPVT